MRALGAVLVDYVLHPFVGHLLVHRGGRIFSHGVLSGREANHVGRFLLHVLIIGIDGIRLIAGFRPHITAVFVRFIHWPFRVHIAEARGHILAAILCDRPFSARLLVFISTHAGLLPHRIAARAHIFVVLTF